MTARVDRNMMRCEVDMVPGVIKDKTGRDMVQDGEKMFFLKMDRENKWQQWFMVNSCDIQVMDNKKLVDNNVHTVDARVESDIIKKVDNILKVNNDRDVMMVDEIQDDKESL
jgi:hypothetical protein